MRNGDQSCETHGQHDQKLVDLLEEARVVEGKQRPLTLLQDKPGTI